MSRRRSIAAAGALLLALSACTNLAPGVPSGGDPYASVNRSLRGERAIVELRDGEVAQGVSDVRFSETKATWVDEQGRRQVPTEQVARVIVVAQPRPSPRAFVLLAGLGLSLLFDDALPLILAVDVALDPFAWGDEVSPAVGRVVYPLAQSAY